jgi:hypothetical protein
LSQSVPPECRGTGILPVEFADTGWKPVEIADTGWKPVEIADTGWKPVPHKRSKIAQLNFSRFLNPEHLREKLSAQQVAPRDRAGDP